MYVYSWAATGPYRLYNKEAHIMVVYEVQTLIHQSYI